MEVNAKQTEVRNVKVELSGYEQGRVAQAQKSELLLGILSKRLEQGFVSTLTVGLKNGAYCVREEYYKGELQWCLVEMDADWDYHNNHVIDTTIRPLTEDEKTKYFHLRCTLAEVETIITELGV